MNDDDVVEGMGIIGGLIVLLPFVLFFVLFFVWVGEKLSGY